MSNRSSRSGKPISGPLYLPALDGLRGLALLLIVFFHLAFAVEHHPGAPTLPQQTEEAASRLASVPDPLHFYFGSTNYFLAFFFILSGFVLFLPIAAKGEFGSIRSFAIRRLFRMIPAFYVSLLILLILIPTVFDPDVLPGYDALGIFSHLTFTHQEFSAPGFGINGALWTVSIDAVFYLILPLIAVWYFRHPFIGLGIGLALGVAWQLITVVPASTEVTPTTAGALKLFVQFPLFADEHALGMTAAWVVVRMMREKESLARRLAPALALGFLALSLGLMYWSSSQAKLLTVFNPPLFFTLAVPVAMTVCLIGTVFLSSRAAWILTNPVARWIGDTSYSAYLYHGIVLVFVFAWLDINVAEELPLALAVYIPGVALCGWVSFTLVERPARTVGHRIARRYSKRGSAKQPPVAVPAHPAEGPPPLAARGASGPAGGG
jgi:peptidoglycan/LPS O-acetylase OafA/YrhL